MLFEFPTELRSAPLPDWPEGVGALPGRLPDGRSAAIPVLSGVNTLVTGVTGTGKTRSFTLPMVSTLLNAAPKTKAVFFEIKTIFLRHFLRPTDKVITHDLRAVAPENLFRPCLVKEIRQADYPEGEMRQIADFLFKESLENANQNRAWIESARNLFLAVLRVVVECYEENTTNRTLVTALRRMTVQELLNYVARHPRNESLLKKDFGYDPANPKQFQPGRRAGDILFFFNQALESFDGAFATDGQDTIRDYLADNRGQRLFFLYDLASAEITRPHFLYYLKKIKDLKMSLRRGDTSPMLWVLDEIDKISDGGKAADFGLYQAATLGREAGLQLIVSTQSVENLYGLAPDFNTHITEGGLAGFPMLVSFRPGDPGTIRTLQTLYGSDYRTHLVMPASRYASPEVKSELEPLVTEAEFAGLQTGTCVVKLGHAAPQTVRITQYVS